MRHLRRHPYTRSSEWWTTSAKGNWMTPSTRPLISLSTRTRGTISFLWFEQLRNSAAALPGIVAAIHGLDPGIGLRNEFTMNEHLHHGAAYYFHSSAAAWMAGSFAGCAFLLGVVGLYGVIAYSVSQRTCEIGIRMALGAQRSSIRRLIIGEAALLVLFGLTFGIAASFFACAFPASSALRRQLVGFQCLRYHLTRLHRGRPGCGLDSSRPGGIHRPNAGAARRVSAAFISFSPHLFCPPSSPPRIERPGQMFVLRGFRP